MSIAVQKLTVCVVGAGVVGQEMLKILAQRKFPAGQIRVLARSSRLLTLNGSRYEVQAACPEAFESAQIALFAGTEGEKGAASQFAREAIARGCTVIDNGSEFRMDPKVPLVLPEVNPEQAEFHEGILANPNCTAAILLTAIAPLHRAFRIRRAIVSTYQAASGAGSEALKTLQEQSQARLRNEITFAPDGRAFNVLPMDWAKAEAGWNQEEEKVRKESFKILGEEFPLSVATARVPVFNGHAESVYLETERPCDPAAAREVLAAAAGLRLVEEETPLDGASSPTPLLASGRDEVLVGRIRRDPFVKNGLWMWICGDNLRKGAALNAIQIAELLLARGWLKPKSRR